MNILDQKIKSTDKIIRYNKNWKPAAEDGSNTFREFNHRFPIEECFRFTTPLKKYQIRFVQHPDIGKNCVRVFTYSFWKKIVFWKWKRVSWTGEREPAELFADEKILRIEDVEKLYGLKL